MISRILLILLVATLIRAVVWWAMVPMWQVPDEQAHFAQLQYYAEKRSLSVPEKNLSTEVALSENLLGTARDQFGNNRYTYHPQYNINYTQSQVGEWEKLINNQPKTARTEMVGSEAAMYPPLYYVLDLPFYNVVYDHGLIDRVFMARLLSVLLGLLLAVTAYFVGLTIWGKGIMPAALAFLVTFQPMVSFVSAGIHPDNLLNLFYSLGILLLLLILKNGVKVKYLFFLALVVFLGLETKQLMFLFLPLAAAVVIYRLSRGKLRFLLPLLILLAPVLVFFFNVNLPYVPQVQPGSPLASLSLFDYLKFRLPKLAFEMWPWYWGVFKWLGVTLPPIVMKIITRLSLLAGIGLSMKLIFAIKNRHFNFEAKALVFFILSSLFYLLYLVLWDWKLMQANGFSQGLQGRYLFPNVVAHMALLLAGLTAWQRFQKPAALVLIVGVVLLNTVALYTLAGSYYDLSSWQSFIVQTVQYKPGVVKMFATMY